jgi:hypothetical protein
MTSTSRTAALLVGVFAVVGLALGIVGYVAVSWAQTRFVAAAAGNAPGEFGPVFVGLVFFQTVVTDLALGTVLAALLGTLAGSRFRDPRRAAATTGAGTGVGCLLLAGLGVGLTGLAGVDQAVGLGPALGPIAATALVGGGAGAAGGVVGATMVR